MRLHVDSNRQLARSASRPLYSHQLGKKALVRGRIGYVYLYCNQLSFRGNCVPFTARDWWLASLGRTHGKSHGYIVARNLVIQELRFLAFLPGTFKRLDCLS